jgi:hypothetical protein
MSEITHYTTSHLAHSVEDFLKGRIARQTNMYQYEYPEAHSLRLVFAIFI